MQIRLENGVVTDNSAEIENGASADNGAKNSGADGGKNSAENGAYYFVKTFQNAKFIDEARQKGAQIIDLKECKRLLNIDENIKIIGITGTNGKTSTAAMIAHFLETLGFKTALAGTRGAFIEGESIDEKALTTAPILKTLDYLRLASREKCKFFVMEVSSHALVQRRIESLEFAAKIYTNLTQDHLDFHGDLAHYKGAKESFFTDESLKFINLDAAKITYNRANALTYGREADADYFIKDINLSAGIEASLKFKSGEIKVRTSLVGLFNLYNLTAAAACINELVRPEISRLEAAISSFRGVRGRLELVAKNVIVDFAHTPDGIENALEALKYKPLIVVFGAGGDRDKSKRALMAKAALKHAKSIIVTSDNPRSEEPEAIISDILEGFNPLERLGEHEFQSGGVQIFTQVDRKKAIQKALNLAKNDEFVVILGKGDEEYQEIRGVKYPFNDKKIVLELLKI